MAFKQFRDEIVSLRSRIDGLERTSTREWIMPDKTLLHVRVWAAADDVTISIVPSIWHPSEGAVSTTMDGKQHRGGFWNRDIDSRNMTAQQLGYLLAARLLVERWVSGQIDELPTDFPAQ